MKKLAHAIALAGIAVTSFTALNAAAQAAPAAAPAPSYTLTPKVGLFSEYEYRGISQTSEKPAIQFNLDYAHSSGFYLGTFVSNIKWLKDYKDLGLVKDSSPVEIDLYGGYKYEVLKDLTLDVGYLHYDYPGAKAIPLFPKPNTNEVYIGATYGVFNVKYSYSLGGTFGVPISKGSSFLELNYSQEVLPKLTLMAQVAKQTYKGNFQGFDNDAELTYTVYKFGPSYDLGDGWTVGGYFKGTDAKEVNYTFKGKDWSKNRLVAFVTKTF
ncbi:MAG TPA: TorF family putative porin [Usitatibacteraceae bacterium]